MNTHVQSSLEIPSSPAVKQFAEVVFNLPLKEAFTYTIPPHFLGKVQIGMRVLVPFGRRKITGYVVNLTDKWDKDITLKNIADLPDTEPVVKKEILSLTKWMADYYQSSWGEAIKCTLPAGLDEKSQNVSHQLVKYVRIATVLPDGNEIERLLKRSPKQKLVFDLVKLKKISLLELQTQIPKSHAALRGLKDKNLIEVFTEKKEREAFVAEDTMTQPFGTSLTFTPGQKAVFKKLNAAIEAERFESFLLHGVTGSGKTEIYIR
ncbi:MAG: primosomal protein N', partial [Nitrospinae bacterium]|nr:primosomal protein N' [Nitrospinota bacterium]